MDIRVPMQSLSSSVSPTRDPFKDYEIDSKDLHYLEELATRTEPLWGALSSTITAIEAELANTQTTQEASRLLPPSAAQVCWLPHSVPPFGPLAESMSLHLLA